MKKHLPGIILTSIICCLLLTSPGSLSGQQGSDRPWHGNISVADSLAQSLAEKIKIYPVPATSELTIENVENVTTIEIFDVTGNKCLHQVCDDQVQLTIEVSELKKGIHFIRFKSPQATIMKRFIKE
ncbi:MAG: T9SS type A sorting domain-containing protein [Bacteroidales bacterium]|nr:T9SS type A sorting domain-containing protein [Bacteroidales bacterium]